MRAGMNYYGLTDAGTPTFDPTHERKHPMKTSELTGPALDWAVAKGEGKYLVFFDEYFTRNGLASGKSQARVESMLDYQPLKGKWCWLNRIGGAVAIPNYSTDWSQGGPIIEEDIFKLFRNVGGSWTAQIKKRVPYYSPTYDADIGADEILSKAGPTPLIAAMRCYCCAKLGDEVEIPEELQPCQQLNP